jgi:hypothetical protein
VARGDLDARWTTFDEYFRILESKGIASMWCTTSAPSR